MPSQQPLCARRIMNGIDRPAVGFAVVLKLSRIACEIPSPMANHTTNGTLAHGLHTTHIRD